MKSIFFKRMLPLLCTSLALFSLGYHVRGQDAISAYESVLQQRAESFVQDFMRGVSRDLPLLLSCYDERVDYFIHGSSTQSQIKTDHEAFIKKYPKRDFIVDDVSIMPLDNNRYRITCYADCTMWDKSENELFRHMLYTMYVKQVGDRFKIEKIVADTIFGSHLPQGDKHPLSDVVDGHPNFGNNPENFVRKYLLGIERDEELLLACYADEVEYFDKGRYNREQIKKDHTLLTHKYPRREYRLRDISVDALSHGRHRLTCSVDCLMWDAEKKSRFVPVVYTIYVRDKGGELEIFKIASDKLP